MCDYIKPEDPTKVLITVLGNFLEENLGEKRLVSDDTHRLLFVALGAVVEEHMRTLKVRDKFY